MTDRQFELTVGTLAGTAVVLLAILALIWVRRAPDKECLVFGVPAGELFGSLATLGVVTALLFSGTIDKQIAGTLLGAHIGYHAAAAGRNRSRTPPLGRQPDAGSGPV